MNNFDDGANIPLPPRAADGHRYDFGSVLIVAGARGKSGSGTLAALAALRSGAGFATWALPASQAIIAKIQSLEVIVRTLPELPNESLSLAAREHLLEAAQEADAMILGPGMSASGETGELIRLLIPEVIIPLIVDAAALRAVATQEEIFKKRANPTILTPHAGEMAWLIKKPYEEIQKNRVEYALNYAKNVGVIVVLKGHRTVITDGKRVIVNQTGNSGMATAGSGDVLTGVIAALIAQQMEPFDAAALGVRLHGLAGDIAAEKLGEHSVIAGDLNDHLPAAFLRHKAIIDQHNDGVLHV